MPTLIVPMSLLRGLVADVQLDIWLLGYMFPVESRFVDTNFCYVGALLSCAGMIRGGITTFVDTYYFEEQVARAADESGMRGEYPSAILLGRARYIAPADRTLRFYREYFQPDTIVEIEKQRRRWRITYRSEDFAVNVDTLVEHPQPGPDLEIKCRTWSRKDAEHKATLIGELLQLFGIDEAALAKQVYVEL